MSDTQDTTPTLALERQDHRLVLQDEDLETLRATYGSDLNESEFRLFVAVARERGLNPLNRQIHALKMGNKMSIQTSIDGFRLIAQRTGRYAGQTSTEWCGMDGVWRDVWLYDDAPRAARVGVYRHGFAQPLYATALYREYVQTTSNGSPNSMWTKMPANQLAKCAEALALRRAFPEELSGVYTDDEMGQALNGPTIDTDVAPPQPSAPQPPSPREAMRLGYNSLTRPQQQALKEWFKASTALPVGDSWPSGVFTNQTDDTIPLVLEAMGKLSNGEIPAPVVDGDPDPDPEGTAVEPDPDPEGDSIKPTEAEPAEEEPAVEGEVVPDAIELEDLERPPWSEMDDHAKAVQLCRNLGLTPPQRVKLANEWLGGGKVRKLRDLQDYQLAAFVVFLVEHGIELVPALNAEGAESGVRTEPRHLGFDELIALIHAEFPGTTEVKP